MSRALDGTNPVAYLGVRPLTPPNMIIPGNKPYSISRDPTQNDIQYNLGDHWLNTTTLGMWYLAFLGSHLVSGINTRYAVWLQFGLGNGTVKTLTGDTGGPVGPDVNGNINTLGTANNITVTGNPGTNTLTWDVGSHVAVSYPTDLGTAVPSANVLNIITANSTNNAGSSVLFTGVGNTVQLNVTDAISNTFIGKGAGNLSTSGAGTNTSIGYNSLQSLTTGAGNTCIGNVSGTAITTGGFNDSLGSGTLSAMTTGGSNVAIGGLAMQRATGNFNVAIGTSTLTNATTGTNNTCVGYISASNLLTGSFNIAVGQDSGIGWTGAESNNIVIGNGGVTGESNALRIGSTGGGAAQQNKCWIAAIRGVTTDVNDAVAVLIDSTGQLGTVSSSIRYKENVEDMGEYSEAIMSLRPVTFTYKNRSSERKSVGLIAEEVGDVMPDLVVFDETGKPETVKYHDLVPLMLNELQKQRVEIDKLYGTISELERLLLIRS